MTGQSGRLTLPVPLVPLVRRRKANGPCVAFHTNMRCLAASRFATGRFGRFEAFELVAMKSPGIPGTRRGASARENG